MPLHWTRKRVTVAEATNSLPLRDYVIIFGAAVTPEGNPSGSLERRIAGAIDWWRLHPDVAIIPTGGVGRHGPAEAKVMCAMLVAAGVNEERIVIEDIARDTLESVILCDRILRERGDVDNVVCCTSDYHQLRCKLLFQVLGYKVITPKMPSDRKFLPFLKYIRFILKEFLSTSYDILQLIIKILLK